MKFGLIIFSVSVLLASCISPEKDWQLAKRDDSQNAYLEFLAKNPDSQFADLARKRVGELKVIRAWDRAEFKDSLTGYQTFIDKYGDSEHTSTARARARIIQRDERWTRINATGSKVATEAFIEEYPDAPQRAEAEVLLAEIQLAEEALKPKERPGAFRIQLAAFHTPAAAELELRRLVAMFPTELLGPVHLETPVEQGSRNMFLLKTVPMSGAEAREVCALLKSRQQQCIIINK